MPILINYLLTCTNSN